MCAVRKQAMGFGLLTHPPAPSQKGRGDPFRMGSDWKSYVSKEVLSREGPPLPFWEGAGGWVVYLTLTHRLRTPYFN